MELFAKRTSCNVMVSLMCLDSMAGSAWSFQKNHHSWADGRILGWFVEVEQLLNHAIHEA